MQEIKKVKITDKNYPEAIKKLSDAPEVLYYRGSQPAGSEPIVAVVGTRRPSDYGQRATLEIAGGLADAGVTIVSGMAPGIDTFAHRTCVERRKRTIAVLGTGIDEKSIYPKSNLQLSRDIIKTGGCLISEYPAGARATKFTFPQRNRIVVALSLGVVVIEGKEKSGSLITARLANEQKKQLFAVPGLIYTLNSIGPNKLIKAGATLTESAQDVLDVLGLESHFAKASRDFGAATPQEAAILQALKEEALYIDKIIEKTKLNASLVATSLALMEISGKIRNLGGNTYSLN